MQKYLGAFLLLLAAAAAVIAVRGGADERALVDDRIAIQKALLDSTEHAITTADDTVAIVASIVEQVAGSLDGVEDAALEAITTIDDAEDGLRKLAQISGEDLPEVISRLKETMPALIQVADVIDGTLGALSFVGVPYDPEQPFDESLAAVADSIEDLPGQVEQQAALIDQVADGLGGIADQAGDLIVEVGLAEQQLRDGLVLLDQYRSTTDEAIDEIDGQRTKIDAIGEEQRSVIAYRTAGALLPAAAVLILGGWLIAGGLRREDDAG